MAQSSRHLPPVQYLPSSIPANDRKREKNKKKCTIVFFVTSLDHPWRLTRTCLPPSDDIITRGIYYHVLSTIQLQLVRTYYSCEIVSRANSESQHRRRAKWTLFQHYNEPFRILHFRANRSFWENLQPTTGRPYSTSLCHFDDYNEVRKTLEGGNQ